VRTRADLAILAAGPPGLTAAAAGGVWAPVDSAVAGLAGAVSSAVDSVVAAVSDADFHNEV
jgi:hypothetical protein